jgi:hypothetical protein
LIRRLDKTIVQFHQDVKVLINQIKINNPAGKIQSGAALFSGLPEAVNKNEQNDRSEIGNPPQG